MKIWFNQAFSMRNVIARIVAERPALSIAASAIDRAAPAADVAPAFWPEPARGTVDYPMWVLDTAQARGVDAVVATRGARALADRRGRFEAAGIALHVAGDAAVLALLDDKAAFAAVLADDPMLAPTHAVRSHAAFVDAVEQVTARGATACVKPITGVYGAGYWTLAADGAFDHLADPDARRIAPAAYGAALRDAEAAGLPVALLVMEHLPGLEASVDVVAAHGSVLLAAVRTKRDANRQRIETRHPLIDHAAGLVARFALHGAVNVQYRQDRNGAWRILEINPRAAGGASYCDAVGIPFSTTWVDVVAGTARSFTAAIDTEIVAVVRAEPRIARHAD